MSEPNVKTTPIPRPTENEYEERRRKQRERNKERKRHQTLTETTTDKSTKWLYRTPPTYKYQDSFTSKDEKNSYFSSDSSKINFNFLIFIPILILLNY